MVETINKVVRGLDRRVSDWNVGPGGCSPQAARVVEKVAHVGAAMVKHEWKMWVVLWLAGLSVLYYIFFPVTWTKARLVSKDAQAAVVHIEGWKLRNCKYAGITSFSQVNGAPKRNARIERVDFPSFSETKPLGDHNMGSWKVWPLEGATHVIVYFWHSCDEGDLRSVKAAEVALG